MSSVVVQASGQEIAFEIEDETGARTYFRLGRHLTTALVLRAISELANLPLPEGELLEEQQPPFLQARPSFQTAISADGDVVLAFRANPLPTMHFLFDDARAAQLSQEISEIVGMPREMRPKKLKH